MSGIFSDGIARIRDFLELGGPVVALLVVLSIVSLALIIFKYWQYWNAGVGRRADLRAALSEWDSGRRDSAMRMLSNSRGIPARLTWQAMLATATSGTDRAAVEEKLAVEAASEIRLLQRGFRALDSIAQIAPLIGLFGTVLGMIEAFQQLQNAGNSVDPSLLAGGIWVALLTTAVGLGVAMPTSLVLTHLESRVARERAATEYALTAILNPVRLGHPGTAANTLEASDMHAHAA